MTIITSITYLIINYIIIDKVINRLIIPVIYLKNVNFIVKITILSTFLM